VLHHVDYVHEKLRQLEVGGFSGDPNDQKRRELRAGSARSGRRVRWAAYGLLAAPFIRTADSALSRLWRRLGWWAARHVPASPTSGTDAPGVTPRPEGGLGGG
jgi:hypothetical protein